MTGSSIAISRSPPEATRQVLAALGLVVPVLAFVITLYAIGDAQPRSLAFHESAAQVIPVLALALAVDARVFSLRRVHDGGDVVVALALVGFLAGGEYEALRALYSGAPERADIVGAAIAAGFAGLASAALTGPPQQP